MKRLIAFASMWMLVVCAGCGDTHESLASEGIATMKEITSVLEGVKDADSAKSAKPKLKSLLEKLNGINERQSKLGVPTEAEMKSMESKYGKDMEEILLKFQAQMMRAALDPKIAPELQDIDFKKSGK